MTEPTNVDVWRCEQCYAPIEGDPFDHECPPPVADLVERVKSAREFCLNEIADLGGELRINGVPMVPLTALRIVEATLSTRTPMSVVREGMRRIKEFR